MVVHSYQTNGKNSSAEIDLESRKQFFTSNQCFMHITQHMFGTDEHCDLICVPQILADSEIQYSQEYEIFECSDCSQ